WQMQMENDFQVRRYIFDSGMQPSTDWNDLNFSGRGSELAGALRQISDRFKSQPLAGVLVLTDGTDTDGLEALGSDRLPAIYPVVVARDETIQDIAIQNVTVTQSAFEDAPVSIQVDASAGGYSGQNLTAQIMEKGKLVAEQTLRAPRDNQLLPFRFQIKPGLSGVLFYEVRVAAQSALHEFESNKTTSEATLVNNSRLVQVDRGRGPYRVLYLSGRPNWEFKFLNRAVAEDDQVQLVGLIRIARREPKFEFRGRSGEASNPLFRGFDRKNEETERYDQPVLVRLNTRDESELRGGFPKTPEELFAFDALVLDDIEAEFFTADQMALMQKFVSERGGGLLMLGGQESFQTGKYHRTPVGDMLPVYLEAQADSLTAMARSNDPKFTLTREGWLQAWARIRSTESDERTRLEEMPAFHVLNRVRGIKPGASVIAALSDGRGNDIPAIVVQRFGNGRTAALTIGDFWRWGLAQENLQRDLGKGWRQMVRWLVADTPRRVEFATHKATGENGQTIDLRVRVRDEKFQPLDNANVIVSVSEVAKPGPPIRLTAEASLQEPGVYQASFVSRQPGAYHANAFVTNAVGGWVGSDEAGWVSDLAEEEFRSLKPNRAALESLARKTGGELITLEKIEKLIEALPRKKAPITESWTAPLWHKPAVFLFALVCFISEWGVRRWKGLP
ncbi:MAG TPA: glutamine amidotransferase, partial [Verrucomicrobiae bacterium]|nr:glutamine amidotransferase [Verrucomicrobiae bacterium]